MMSPWEEVPRNEAEEARRRPRPSRPFVRIGS
jgi:hypothetical protein